MAEKPAIRRRTPTTAERERIRKAIEGESRPEVMEGNRELGRTVLAKKREAVAATAAVLQTLLDEKERQQISLADLEAKTGIGRSNLSRLWNQSEPGVTLETVERIAAALNLQVSLIPQK